MRKHRKRLTSKGVAMREAILSNPDAHPANLQRLLALRKIKTTPASLRALRRIMRAEELDVPKRKRGPRADTKTSRIKKAIRDHLRAQPGEIVEILRKKRVFTTPEVVINVKSSMRKDGERISDLRRDRPLPELNAKQKRLKKKLRAFVMRVGRSAISEYRPSAVSEYRVTKAGINDFLTYLDKRLTRWVANYDPKRFNETQFKAYLVKAVRAAANAFVTREIKKRWKST